MSDFIQRPKRCIELPLGCEDLIDVEEIRSWKAARHPDWLRPPTTDRLAYSEGFLARRLESAGESTVVCISGYLDQGQVFFKADGALLFPVIFALWNGAAQERSIRSVFEERGISPATEPIGRWKAKRSLKYLLPTDPSEAARLIGEVFRVGYSLGDFSLVNFQ